MLLPGCTKWTVVWAHDSSTFQLWFYQNVIVLFFMVEIFFFCSKDSCKKIKCLCFSLSFAHLCFCVCFSKFRNFKKQYLIQKTSETPAKCIWQSPNGPFWEICRKTSYVLMYLHLSPKSKSVYQLKLCNIKHIMQFSIT